MKITKAMLNTPGWVFSGLFYGYPLCCIKEFNELKHLHLKHFKLIGTGYVPCSKCRSKSKAELIKVITDNRFDPKPFPEESEWDEREEFVKRLIKEGLPEKWKALQPVLNQLIKNRKGIKNK